MSISFKCMNPKCGRLYKSVGGFVHLRKPWISKTGFIPSQKGVCKDCYEALSKREYNQPGYRMGRKE